MHRVPLVAWLVCLLSSSVAWGVGVTLDPGSTPSVLTVIAGEGSTFSEHDVQPVAAPFSDSDSIAHGASSASSTYDLSDSGFLITFDHGRNSVHNAFGRSDGEIRFSVDSDVDYVADAAYTAIDPDGRSVHLQVFLSGVTVPGNLFNSTQRSLETPNEAFVLGGTGGDFHNGFVGSLEGTLLAGHEYVLSYSTHVYAITASSQPATGSGFVSLTFVPEPSTALLVAAGLVGLAARRPRRGGTDAGPASESGHASATSTAGRQRSWYSNGTDCGVLVRKKSQSDTPTYTTTTPSRCHLYFLANSRSMTL